MILCFELSMPGRNSWNGRWSGEDRLYAVVKNMGKTKKAAERSAKIIGSHGYSFRDGWHACVSVKEVDAKQAAKIRRNSAGFCGYNWMVDSILTCGEIKP